LYWIDRWDFHQDAQTQEEYKTHVVVQHLEGNVLYEQHDGLKSIVRLLG